MLRWRILILLSFVLALAWPGGLSFADSKAVTKEEVVWKLTQTAIVSQGETVTMENGTMVSGFTLQANAKARHNNIVPDGKIVFNLSAFSPSRELPGQVPGTWYIQGKWEITGRTATKESRNASHSADKAQGFIKAELPFNPLTEPGNWSGLAWVPSSSTAGRWSTGEGSMTLDGGFEGDLVLLLNRLPAMK